MSTITYEELQVENLITFDYISIAKNFKTIDAFIKNFTTFQRKFNDFQKLQKATAHDLSNFKLSTANTFSTMNQILDSRGSISKGNNKAIQEDMNELKKTIKQLKTFVTESTRDINATFETKQKQTQQIYKKYDTKFIQIYTYRESDKLRMQSLENEVYTIKSRYTLKTQSDIIRSNLNEAKEQIKDARENLEKTQQFLQNLGVKQFKETLDAIKKQVDDDLSTMKTKLKLKTDISDTLKLQDMLLNTINMTYENVVKKYSNKNQTKKALVYLEKKINNIIQNLYPQEEEKDGLLAVKNWKCISCTKDLGEYEGKLDKFKPWAVFPAKDNNNKDKYGGFGTAFQSIVETAVSKKGADINYDEKGRMTTPFNLTREVQSNLKPSHSQNKLSQHIKNSPSKGVSQSNYMSLFGRNSEVDIDIRSQYLQKERGLMQISKIKFE